MFQISGNTRIESRGCDQSVNFAILCHNSYISTLFNFDDLTQEHIGVKRVDLVYFVVFVLAFLFAGDTLLLFVQWTYG